MYILFFVTTLLGAITQAILQIQPIQDKTKTFV
jgi:hypothetical protein